MPRPPVEATPASDDDAPEPSRRALLAACGAAGLTALAGCTDLTHAPSAYCQLKGISVSWAGTDGEWRDEVAWVVADDGEESLSARVAEELPTTVEGPRDLTVDEGTHEELAAVFEDVSYILGFCGTAFANPHREDGVGCRNTDAASRADFNRVQAGDAARVTLLDDAFRVQRVDAVDAGDWEREMHRQDFSALHADHDLPAAWADADD